MSQRSNWIWNQNGTWTQLDSAASKQIDDELRNKWNNTQQKQFNFIMSKGAFFSRRENQAVYACNVELNSSRTKIKSIMQINSRTGMFGDMRRNPPFSLHQLQQPQQQQQQQQQESIIWSWKDETQTWRVYDDITQGQLELAYAMNQKNVSLNQGPYFGVPQRQNVYHVSLDNPASFVQINSKTGYFSEVRRAKGSLPSTPSIQQDHRPRRIDDSADREELGRIKMQHKLLQENIKMQDYQIRNLTKNKNDALMFERKEMESAERDYKRYDDQVNAAIDKTGQTQENVERFLKLIHSLIGQTATTQANADKLDSQINTFRTLIERECQDKLTVESYFSERNLDRFIPILANRGIILCQHLIRNNEDEVKRDILDYLERKINQQIEEWNQLHPNQQDRFEKLLEKYGLLKYKARLCNEGLTSLDDIRNDLDNDNIDEFITAAKITGFLNIQRFKRAINDVQTGKYPEGDDGNDNIDDEDEKGLEPDGKDKERPREISQQEKREIIQICLRPNVWREFEKEKATMIKNSLLKMSPILAHFFDVMNSAVISAQKLLALNHDPHHSNLNTQQRMAIAELDNDDIKDRHTDPIITECRAITSSIMVQINIIGLFQDQFEVSATTKRVLPIAQGVEESVKGIMLCQSQMRQFVRLAGSILKLKPANLTDSAKPLWSAVDDGIVHIIATAMEMSKISAQYFGYFLRFNGSFQRFISMNKANKDVTLFTSLEHIKNDIQEFSKFKKTFNAKVQELSDQAMQVIRKCVETQIGAQQFEETRAAREKAKEDYLNKKAKYDVESLRLDAELERLKDKKSQDMGEEAALKIRIAHLNQRKKDNEEFKQTWIKEIDELNKLSFDTGGALDSLLKAEENALKQGK